MSTSTLPHPTADWSPLASSFYRKSALYSLSWGVSDLSDHLIAVAPHGGLVAFARDPAKLMTLSRATALRPKIAIYTCAGQLVESIPWDNSNRIVALGFTSKEQLVVVLDEGVVRLYTLFSPCPAPRASGSGAPGSSNGDGSTGGAGSPASPVEATATSYYVSFSLGTEATDNGLTDARIWPGGLVALTSNGRFIEWHFPSTEGADADAWYNGPPKASRAPVLLPPLPPGLSTTPKGWSVLTPDRSTSGMVEVLISPASSGTESTLAPGTLLSLDSLSGATDLRLTRGPFSTIRSSPNGKLLALLCEDGTLWVVSADLQRSLSEFDIKTSCEAFSSRLAEGAVSGNAARDGMAAWGIRQVEWCGDNTVALSWEDEVVMVGPFGDSLSYPYSGAVFMAPDLDGLRIISSDRYEFLQKVPDCTSHIFRPGSSHASAILFDAAEQFVHRSAKADDAVRAIQRDLQSAVETCVEAAGYEWESGWQKKLMRAASFGKAFLDRHDPSSFVDMAKTLRVLNAVRRYEIGLPISYDQYQQLTPTALLARLALRNHHLLALRIASSLTLRPEPILKHWARAKIARSRGASGALAHLATGAAGAKADDELCEAIVSKFEGQPAVSYAEIARDAWEAGRTRLATKLLDHESRAVDQVPLLLSMHEDKLALIKAIESYDMDLVYHVLLRLKAQLSRGDFFRIVQAPVTDAMAPGDAAANAAAAATTQDSSTAHLRLASKLLEIYAREEDHELLRDFYYQDDRRTESAMLSLEEAGREKLLSSKVEKLKEAGKLFGEEKERALESKLVDENVRLLAFQSALEQEDGGRATFVGLSLNETIRQCLQRNMSKKAEKLRADWKVPDKRFWGIKISALIATRDWEGLWSFANAKRSPIGYEPFVQRLVAAGHTREALRYVAKCQSDKADRARLSALIQRLPPAAANALVAKQQEVQG